MTAPADFAAAQYNRATALHAQGQLGPALAAYRAVVAAAPEFAPARVNLGQLLLDLGRPAEALAHFQEAVRLHPSAPAAHVHLGNAWRALRRWEQAHAAYATALRLAPDMARAHSHLGWTLYLQGQRAEAFRCLHRAVQLAANDSEPWQLLAQAYVQEADYAAAIACQEHLVALNPSDPARHKDLGWLLHSDGRLDEAAACYRRALELQPGSVDALLYQGLLHADWGAAAEAEACYRQALHANPSVAAPLAQLAELLRERLPESDRHALLSRLGDPEVQGRQRVNLLFAMAHVQDALGEYATSAALLAQANALALTLRREQGQRYDAAEHSRSVDGLMATYTLALIDRLAAAGDASRVPVFILGLPRSGTSLVEQVLAAHPRVHGAGELRLARQTMKLLDAQAGAAGPLHARLHQIAAADVHQLARHYLNGLEAVVRRDRPGFTPERVTDKMPENYFLLGFLALLFPHATFIHLRRDLRDVAVSCWATNFHALRWTNDPEHIAARFGDYRRLMARWQAVLPVRMHEVVYERLVDDFEAEARRLVAACGLDWDPACLSFHAIRRPVQSASGNQVRQPLYRKALARWKHYEEPLAALFVRLPLDGSIQ
jgi:tetratricopeptide (TPR) repeat protein